jgi:dolichol-phosphate mannosyltransferase
MPDQLISIIFPVFNEKDNLAKLLNELNAVTSKLGSYRFEYIFVDDCSSDQSPQILRELFAQDKRIRVVRFSRNYGSHAAISCGLNICRGDAAIILAADLQDPLDLIGRLIDEWRSGEKANIVWGVRNQRLGETSFTIFLSRLYYSIINGFTSVRMPPTGADVFLIDRKVIDAYKGISEKNASIVMTLHWLGFSQKSMVYNKQKRFKGKSHWTITKKIKVLIDSIVAFSDVPIRFISILGICTACLGFLYALFILWTFMHGSPVQGWASLMVVTLCMGGVQMVMLGVLGEYLCRTYDESRKRPRYIVDYTLDP